MSQLGTYSTIDCPTQKVDEAYKYLQSEFAKIGGIVRKISNPHDFGNYPSFEIDYPKNVMEASDYVDLHENDDLDDPDSTQEEFDKQQAILDDWTDKANEIEAEYNKKFYDFL